MLLRVAPDAFEIPPVPAPRWTLARSFVCALAAMFALWLVFLFWPVCEPLGDDAAEAAFQTVRSLEERAAGGEPFEKKSDGRWYLCKSRFVRAFTF
jgi:hypothetical protein